MKIYLCMGNTNLSKDQLKPLSSLFHSLSQSASMEPLMVACLAISAKSELDCPFNKIYIIGDVNDEVHR
jgi:hypothetical protein